MSGCGSEGVGGLVSGSEGVGGLVSGCGSEGVWLVW